MSNPHSDPTFGKFRSFLPTQTCDFICMIYICGVRLTDAGALGEPRPANKWSLFSIPTSRAINFFFPAVRVPTKPEPTSLATFVLSFLFIPLPLVHHLHSPHLFFQPNLSDQLFINCYLNHGSITPSRQTSLSFLEPLVSYNP